METTDCQSRHQSGNGIALHPSDAEYSGDLCESVQTAPVAARMGIPRGVDAAVHIDGNRGVSGLYQFHGLGGQGRPVVLWRAALGELGLAGVVLSLRMLRDGLFLAASPMVSGVYDNQGICQNQRDRSDFTCAISALADLCRLSESGNRDTLSVTPGLDNPIVRK